MEIKPNEIMNNYLTIVEAQDAVADAPVETPWHGEIEFEEARTELEVNARTMYLENAIVVEAREEDLATLREKKHPVEKEDMVEKAHPDPVYVSNALGDGGLVENQNEQQAKIIEIINKLPTGNHIHLYAEAIMGLQKIASDMEEEGLEAETILVDATLAELAADLKKKVITKEAFWPMIGLVGLGLVGGGALLSGVLGIQENLAADSNDLVNNIRGWMGDSEYQAYRTVIQRLYQNATKMQGLSRRILSATSRAANTTDAAAGQQVASLTTEFERLLTAVQSDVELLASVYPGKTGLDFQRTKGLVRDVQGSLANLGAAVTNVTKTRERSGLTDDVKRVLQQQESGAGATPAAPAGSVAPGAEPSVSDKERISEIQKILSQNASIQFGNKNYPIVKQEFSVDGTLNMGTKDALHNLASAIRRRFGQVRNLPGSRLYNATPAQIRDLIDFAQDPWSRMSQLQLSEEVYPRK